MEVKKGEFQIIGKVVVKKEERSQCVDAGYFSNSYFKNQDIQLVSFKRFHAVRICAG